MKLKLLEPNDPAKLFSFLFAVILWFHVATGREYRWDVDIPIRYGEPAAGLMLASTPPSAVGIAISGTGRSLLAFRFQELAPEDRAYTVVPLANLDAGPHQIAITPDDVLLSLADDITIDGVLRNGAFEVVLDRRVERTIPVDPDSLPAYQVAEGFMLTAPPLIDPARVTVTGARGVLDDLTSLAVERLERTTVTERDSVMSASLADPSPFVDLERGDVQVHFTLERVRTKLFRGVPVTLSGFPRWGRPAAEPDTLSVLIQGPESVISKARPEDIAAVIDYAAYQDRAAEGDSLFVPAVAAPPLVTGQTTPAAVRLVPPS